MRKKLTLHRVTVRNLAPEETVGVDGNGIVIPRTVICTHTCVTCAPSCYNTCLGGIC